MSQPAPDPGVVLGPCHGPPQTWSDPQRGSVSFWSLFDADLTPTVGLCAGVAEVAPGEHFLIHRHTPAEVYFILAGEGSMALGTSRHDVTAGSSVFIPSGAWHGISNTGAATLRFHYVMAADRLDDVDYAFPDSDGSGVQ